MVACPNDEATSASLFALAINVTDEKVEIPDNLLSFINDKDERGWTVLHNAARAGHLQFCVSALKNGAYPSLLSHEPTKGWTPLHVAFHYGNFRLGVLLLKALGPDDAPSSSSSSLDNLISPLRGVKGGKIHQLGTDFEGNTAFDLLSKTLRPYLFESRQSLECTSVFSFGKANFTLGVALPNSNTDVIRPKRVEELVNHSIVNVAAHKHHSLALTKDGHVFSWGYGRSGKLGHGDEVSQPVPRLLTFFTGMRVTHISAAENHTLAVTDDGSLFSWGSDRFGQLGHGGCDQCFTPRRVDALKKLFVAGIAAGDSHSICFTADGQLFAWGSSKHGQLGIRPTELGVGTGGGVPGCAIPKRVNIGILSSYARSKSGNSQKKNPFYKSGSFDDTSSSGAYACSNSSSAGCPILQVSAAPFSTLLLCRSSTGNAYPSRPGLNSSSSHPVNEVYQWGHGCWTPTKVTFARTSGMYEAEVAAATAAAAAAGAVASAAPGMSPFSSPSLMAELRGRSSSFDLDFSSPGNDVDMNASHSTHDTHYSKEKDSYSIPTTATNIVQVSAGKYHNVALSSAAHVYTWGMGCDQLGHPHGQGQGSMSDTPPSLSTTPLTNKSVDDSPRLPIRQPQLVEALLPKNGGCNIVHVFSTANRTCVISDTGDLYTWGATQEQGVLGHGAGSYQPTPKRVVGVKRAICVAGGEDHTLVITCASVPALPLSDIVIPASKVNSLGAGNMKGVKEDKDGYQDKVDYDDEEDEDEEDDEDEDGDDLDDTADIHTRESNVKFGGITPQGEKKLEDATRSGTKDTEIHLQQQKYQPKSDSLEKTKSFDSNNSQTIFFPHVPTLKQLCERQVATSVDTRNAISALRFSEDYNSPALAAFCTAFIRRNLDAVLVQGRSSDLDLLLEGLDCWQSVSRFDFTHQSNSKVGGGQLSHQNSRERRNSEDEFNAMSGNQRCRSGSGGGNANVGKGRGGSFSESAGKKSFQSNSFDDNITGIAFPSSSSSSSSSSSAALSRSSAPAYETSESVSKRMRALRKKILNIEELEQKLHAGASTSSGSASSTITKEQQDKIYRKKELESELDSLALLFDRLSGEERIREKALERREAMEVDVANAKKDGALKSSASKPQKVEIAEGALSTTSSNAGNQGTASKASDASKQKGKLQPPHSVNNMPKQPSHPPTTKSAIGGPPPSLAAWQSMLSAPKNNADGNTPSPIQLDSSTKLTTPPIQSPPSTWQQLGPKARDQSVGAHASPSTQPPLDSTPKKAKSYGQPDSPAEISISTVGPHGRTVLSPWSSPPPIPPTPPPTTTSTGAPYTSPSNPMSSKKKGTSTNLPISNVVFSLDGPSSRTSTATKASPASANPGANSPSTLAVAPQGSSGSSLSLADCFIPKHPPSSTVSTTPPPRAWGGSGMSHSCSLSNTAVSTSSSPMQTPQSNVIAGNNNSQPSSQPRAATFKEIQDAEEDLRRRSTMTSLLGNENPWYIDRRPRAESIDELVKKLEDEKKREDESRQEVMEIEMAIKLVADRIQQDEEAEARKKNKKRGNSNSNKNQTSRKSNVSSTPPSTPSSTPSSAPSSAPSSTPSSNQKQKQRQKQKQEQKQAT